MIQPHPLGARQRVAPGFDCRKAVHNVEQTRAVLFSGEGGAGKSLRAQQLCTGGDADQQGVVRRGAMAQAWNRLRR